MYKITKQQSTLALALLLSAATSSAREFSYNYVEGLYFSSTIELGSPEGDIDANGFGLAGSFAIAPKFAINIGYATLDVDKFEGIDIDVNQLTFGITGHTAIAPKTDVFGNFSILKSEIEVSTAIGSGEDDDTGSIISVGLRHLATDSVELNFVFSHEDVFDETENAIGLGARFYANERFSIGLGYETADDIDTISLSARIDFK